MWVKVEEESEPCLASFPGSLGECRGSWATQSVKERLPATHWCRCRSRRGRSHVRRRQLGPWGWTGGRVLLSEKVTSAPHGRPVLRLSPLGNIFGCHRCSQVVNFVILARVRQLSVTPGSGLRRFNFHPLPPPLTPQKISNMGLSP